ncbi:hypothetical protein N7510_006374 [Penicillium lagena]|uniref:uncharacterized protein n=1 Tax=Penicillium lagena TaxID=94218 RepID=UPI00253FAEB0|nr:uncharacterized protein N7510_006374 [Penicillium lagena]KAJ5613180.1 hypothetical protein N7510_006374 [Penicillium lagena]
MHRAAQACARCYKRKKRCDRGVPACSGCRKANVECHGISRSDNTQIPRNIARFLESAIADLELQLGNRSAAAAVRHQCGDAMIPRGFMAPLPRQFCPSITQTRAVPYKASFLQQSNFPPQRKLAALAVPAAVARTLFDVYINRLLPQYPLFHPAELEKVFAQVYVQGEQQPWLSAEGQRHLFIASMVLANSGCAYKFTNLGRNRSFYSSLQSDALSMLSCVQHTSLESLQCMLLLVQHALLNPQSGSLYNLAGDAMKIAIALGLHQEPVCVDINECDLRRSLFWASYVLDRSINITGHRPLALRDEHITVHHLTDKSRVHFVNHVRYRQLQSEMYAVQFHNKPIPSGTYQEWMDDMGERIMAWRSSALSSIQAPPEWFDFGTWTCVVLLHRPCIRNPNPSEASIKESFEAAVRISDGYWEQSQDKHVKYTFHAVHNAFESGLVLLYAIEVAPDILRQNYGVKRVLDVVNQISALFLVISKIWPDAMLVGDRYDELQKAVTKRFVQEPDEETAYDSALLDCLRDMLFRVNRDARFSKPGHQFPVSPSDQGSGQWSNLLAPPLEGQSALALGSSMDIDMEWLATNTLDDSWELSVFEWPGFPPDMTDTPSRPAVASPPALDRTAVDTAIELLPACRQCRERRVRCDRGFPSCQNCRSSQAECMHKDPVSGEMTPRKYIAALHRTFTSLMDEWESTEPVRIESTESISPTASSVDYDKLQLFGPSTAMAEVTATLTAGVYSQPAARSDESSWFLSSGCSMNIPPPHVRSEILPEIKPLNLVYPIFQETDEFLLSFTQKQNLPATAENLLVIAICLQLRSKTDPRYKGPAMAYFNGALHKHSTIDFTTPSIHQIQIFALECLFILLCPTAGDIWRMSGAAVRACVELCEEYNTIDETCWLLLRTVFCLEISICVALGRPPQSPCLYESLKLDVPPTHAAEAFQIALCNVSWLQALDLIDLLAGVPSPVRLETLFPGPYDDPMQDQFSQYLHARALRSPVSMAQALSMDMVRTRFPFSWVDAHEVAAAVLRPSQPAQSACLQALRWMAADPDLACQDLYDSLAVSV